ncbi:MAG: hypothetical protein OET90_03160 [Desulfuromonadales bacterium]|nr:hypothetical protein [Desulfuromonadales bacterium]
MKVIYHIILTLMLVLTIAAGLCAFAWRNLEQEINSLDSYMVEDYVAGYENELSEIKALKSPEEKITRLKALEVKLEPVKLLDRLSKIKVQVYKDLIRQLLQINAHDKAVATVDRWIAHNARDLTAAVSKVQVLYQNPQTRAQSKKLMAEIFKKHPDVLMVAKTHQQMLSLGADR